MSYWGEAAQKESISGVFDALGLARQGINLREEGNLDAAEEIFETLTREHPSKSFGWQEMGVLLVRRGQDLRALEFFKRAVDAEPGDLLTRSHYAIHLQELGRLHEAHQAIDDHPAGDEVVTRRLLAMKDFLTYLSDWPKMRGLTYPNHIEVNRGFLKVEEIERRIMAAISANQPFSMLRLGDGEGAWVRLDADDETKYKHLYEFNRREMLRIWFGNEWLMADATFQALRSDLMDSIYSCDVLGVPYSLRINREYSLKSVRGVPSCLNILRFYVDNMWGGPADCCSHDIHVELQDSGFFGRLFKSGAPLGIITCHHKLPFKMAQETGAMVVQAHLIPEEKGFTDVLGYNGINVAHYPNVFNRVLHDLESKGQKGIVWLVAAGYLGKIYCGAIRRQGGIALDVGSLADGWCDKITRPPLRNRERFALERA